MAEKTVKRPDRRERLAAALRENLKKRKIHARGLVGAAEDTSLQPSIEIDEIDLTTDENTGEIAVSPAARPR
jgi:hypothetical protein